jgi:hypothetical protein
MQGILLQLDEASGRDLRDALYLLGEHIAAGMTIPELPETFHKNIGRVLQELDLQLTENDEVKTHPSDAP